MAYMHTRQGAGQHTTGHNQLYAKEMGYTATDKQKWYLILLWEFWFIAKAVGWHSGEMGGASQLQVPRTWAGTTISFTAKKKCVVENYLS